MVVPFGSSSPLVNQPSFLRKEGLYLGDTSSTACLRRMTSTTSSSLEDSTDELGDDLTKYELGLRLKEVRDYYREHNTDDVNKMSQEAVCLSLFRTRLPKLRLNRCTIGAQSTITGAGRGLFATRDIADGELITLYPGDVMLAWETTVGDFGTSGDVGVLFGTHVRKEDQKKTADRLTTDSARAYELKIGGRHSVVADPFLVDDAAYLGHLANDASSLNSRDKASVDEYVEASNQGHNAAHLVLEGSHFVTLATRSIGEGEEIFVSYGYSYWFSRSSRQKIKGSSSTSTTGADTTTATTIETPIRNNSSTRNTDRVTSKKVKRSTNRTDAKKGFGKK